MDSWTLVNKKRKASSPIANREKERKGEPKSFTTAEINKMESETSQNDQPNTANTNAGPLSSSQLGRWSMASRESFQSVVSNSTIRHEKPTRESIFTTPKPEGAFRDEIVVELQTLDGEPYRGKIDPNVAIRKIFMDKLGFKRQELNGMIIGYGGGQIVKFKLFAQFDIDQLKSIEYFEIEKQVQTRSGPKMSILKCRVRGIRIERGEDVENYQDEGVRWVKIEGCEWRVDQQKIVEWLSYFGEIRSDITEDEVEEEKDSGDDQIPVGNGIYSVKMKLTKDLPQFMPMLSKRIRIYHRGIVKRCTNCFGPHLRRVCQNDKVSWFDYVQKFIKDHPDIPIELYGKWGNMSERHLPYQARTQQTEKSTRNPAALTERAKQTEVISKNNNAASGNVEREEVEKVVETEENNGSQEEEIADEEGEGLTDEEELNKMVREMLASGFTAKSIKKKIAPKTKKEKDLLLRTTSSGAGRGRGTGRGKPN